MKYSVPPGQQKKIDSAMLFFQNILDEKYFHFYSVLLSNPQAQNLHRKPILKRKHQKKKMQKMRKLKLLSQVRQHLKTNRKKALLSLHLNNQKKLEIRM